VAFGRPYCETLATGLLIADLRLPYQISTSEIEEE